MFVLGWRTPAQHCPAITDHADELLARAEEVPADEFERDLRTWARDHTTDGGAAAFERQRARRRLRSFTTDDGMVALDVQLDPVAGATVTSTLDRIAEQLWRTDEDGARTCDLGMRRADALVDLCRRAAGVELATITPSVPALMVLIDHQTLAGQVAEHPVCRLADGTPLSPATARRLACQAAILPVVLDGASQPLDVGRARRLPTPAQRKALLVRDGGCVFPGCDRPVEWCDVHHLQPWERGGATDLANLVTICERHHHLVHEGGWQLTRGPAGDVTAVAPDGAKPAARACPPTAPTNGDAAACRSDQLVLSA